MDTVVYCLIGLYIICGVFIVKYKKDEDYKGWIIFVYIISVYYLVSLPYEMQIKTECMKHPECSVKLNMNK